MIAGIPLILLWGDMKLRLMILFMLPMTADGFLQLFTSYESKNGRRFATGVLFGLAFDSLLIHFHRACVMAAGWIVKLFIEDSGAVERAMELFCDTDTRGIKTGEEVYSSPVIVTAILWGLHMMVSVESCFFPAGHSFYRDSRPPDTRSVRLG